MNPVERVTTADAVDWPALRAIAKGWGLRDMVELGFTVEHCRGQLAYLATPYSKPVIDPMDGEWCCVRSEDLAREASRWARSFALDGVTAVSPIVLADGMVQGDLHEVLDPLDHMFWTTWCRPLLSKADCVVVPPMAHRFESLGVWQEVRWALMHQVPVYLIAEGQG